MSDNVHNIKFFADSFVFDRMEVELVPFTWCNMHCDFCETRYNRIKPNIEYFHSAYEKIIEKVEQNNVKVLVVEMWGGELFADKIFNRLLFDSYQTLFTKLDQYTKQHDIKREFCIKTNLVHHNVDSVIELCQSISDLKVGTSFDFCGRFNDDSQIDLWYDNMIKLTEASFSPDITVVAHKRNIDYVTSEHDHRIEIFDKIYRSRKYNIDFEYYRDVNNLGEYAISDQQIGEFIKYIVQHYPNISESYNLIKIKHHCSKNIFAEGLPNYYLKIWPNSIEWNSVNDIDKFKQVVINKGCASCVYKGKCSPRYALEYDNTSYCINRDVFDFLKCNDAKFEEN